MDEEVFDHAAARWAAPGADEASELSVALCAVVGCLALQVTTVLDPCSGVRERTRMIATAFVLRQVVAAEQPRSCGPVGIELDRGPHLTQRGRSGERRAGSELEPDLAPDLPSAQSQLRLSGVPLSTTMRRQRPDPVAVARSASRVCTSSGRTAYMKLARSSAGAVARRVPERTRSQISWARWPRRAGRGWRSPVGGASRPARRRGVRGRRPAPDRGPRSWGLPAVPSRRASRSS